MPSAAPHRPAAVRRPATMLATLVAVGAMTLVALAPTAQAAGSTQKVKDPRGDATIVTPGQGDAASVLAQADIVRMTAKVTRKKTIISVRVGQLLGANESQISVSLTRKAMSVDLRADYAPSTGFVPSVRVASGAGTKFRCSVTDLRLRPKAAKNELKLVLPRRCFRKDKAVASVLTDAQALGVSGGPAMHAGDMLFADRIRVRS